jgi:hypothetical protein
VKASLSKEEIVTTISEFISTLLKLFGIPGGAGQSTCSTTPIDCELFSEMQILRSHERDSAEFSPRAPDWRR